MDFEYSDEQKQLAEAVGRYLDKEYDFEARKRIVRSEAGFSETVWQQFAEMGLLALPWQESYGGFDGGAVDMMPVMEAMGRALVVEPYLSTAGLAGQLIARAGSDDQKSTFLPAIAQGSIKLALAHSEPLARYQRHQVRTRAQRSGKGSSGSGWVLDGEKCMVMHGPLADQLVVSARLQGEPDDAQGVGLFVVDARAAGLTQRAFTTVDGMQACDLKLQGVQVDAQARLGEAEVQREGLDVLDEVLDFGSALACSEAVGVIEYVNEQTLAYLKTRKQFGKPIGTNQALQHRMVELMISEEQARSMACLAAVKVDTEKQARARSRFVSAACIRVAQACRLVSQESVQMHGGIGMTEELKVSHCFRRLTVLAQQFGDLDFHLERFAMLDRELSAPV